MEYKKTNINSIRYLIKNIFELSKKTSGVFKVNNIEQAAELVVNLYGYKNWKEFKKYNEIDNLDIKKQPSLIFENKIIESNNSLKLSKKYNINFEQLIENKKTNKNNLNIFHHILIGYINNKSMKTPQPHGLYLTNTVIIGKEYKKILDIHLSNYNKYNVPYLKFEKSNEINKYKFNPLKKILASEEFDNIFNIQENTFGIYFSNIVKKLITNNYKVMISDIYNLTKLDYLYCLFNTSDTYIKNNILEYFKSLNIDINNATEISKDIINTHYSNNKNLINFIYIIKELYEKNIFSEFEYKELNDVIYQKENLDIYLNNNEIFNFLILKEYEIIKKEYESNKLINKELNSYFVIFENINTNISKSEKIIEFHYCKEYNNIIDNTIKNVNQIVFTRQPDEYDNTLLQEKILNYTLDYRVNFWYNKNNILKNLDEKECIVWQENEEPFQINELENYTMFKLELM